ncbi:MAG: glycosyltransferase family 2 protein [Parcubacteria group bacterium]
MPELSIIIVHYRTPDFLKICLDSILNKVQDIEYEVIVVDHSATRVSKDLAQAWKERFARFKYIPRKENLGYSKGVNTGIAISEGQYILIVNPDTIFTEEAIPKMLSYMKQHEDIGLLAPQMLHFNGEHQRNYFKFYTPKTVIARRTFLGKLPSMKRELDDFLMLDTDPNEIQTPDWIMGSALLTSQKALKKVGPMDERFFMYFEDVDWARRFWHNGYKVVYYPEAQLYHYHQRQSKSKFGVLDVILNQKTRWHVASAVKFFLKYRTLEVFKKNL